MGKKQGQASSKVTNSNNERKQLSSWTKVLRPKVYITDSSSFKRLVQELTGDRTTISKLQTIQKSTASSSTNEDHRELESCLETSANSSSESHDHPVSFPEQELNQSYNQLIYLDDSTSPDDLLWMNQEGDYKKTCQDLVETLLPDIDQYDPFYGSYSQILQEEVSIYDYELCGLL